MYNTISKLGIIFLFLSLRFSRHDLLIAKSVSLCLHCHPSESQPFSTSITAFPSLPEWMPGSLPRGPLHLQPSKGCPFIHFTSAVGASGRADKGCGRFPPPPPVPFQSLPELNSFYLLVKTQPLSGLCRGSLPPPQPCWEISQLIKNLTLGPLRACHHPGCHCCSQGQAPSNIVSGLGPHHL